MTRRPAALLVAALALAALGCPGEEVEQDIETGTAEVSRIERLVVATGTIEPDSEVEVRPRIAGIVEKIHVEKGDTVEQGQLLLEIDRELLESQVREARAAVRSAEVERRFAKIDFDRVLNLLDRGVASPSQLDTARSRFETAGAALARAQAQLESLEVQLRYSSVRSPLAGRVLAVHVEEGDAVSQVTAVTGGSLLMSLAGTDSLHLLGLVDENEIARVKVGQPARVRTEAYGDRVFEGEVAEISPMGERVQNVTYFEVEIEITDDDASLLKPRMSGDAEIVTEVVEDALTIPETALRYRGDGIYVETVSRDGAEGIVPKDIEIGIVDGTRVQVLSGLRPGEEVRLQ